MVNRPSQAESPVKTVSGVELDTPGKCRSSACSSRGLANKEMARVLEIEEVTIKLHMTRIFKKLGVRNRAQAAVRAMESVDRSALDEDIGFLHEGSSVGQISVFGRNGEVVDPVARDKACAGP